MKQHNVRYIVAYNSNDDLSQRAQYATEPDIYWYKAEAERVAKRINGWVVTVNIEPNT